jgi:hypothetical protein
MLAQLGLLMMFQLIGEAAEVILTEPRASKYMGPMST